MYSRLFVRSAAAAYPRAALVLALVLAAGLGALTHGWAVAIVLLFAAAAVALWRDKVSAIETDDPAYFRAAFEAAPGALLLCNADGALVSWTRTAAELLAASPQQLDALNLRTSALSQATGFWLAAEAVLQSGVTRELEVHGTTEWGASLQLRCRLAGFEQRGARHLVVLLTDISHEVAERKQAEARAAQNLQGMTTLAGKMAHDFNNILASITGYVAAAQQTELSPDTRQCLDAAMAASARGERVALQLSSLGVPQVTRRLPVELRRVVREAVDAVRPALRAGVELNVVLPPDALLVVGDSAELQQAITTLATHAARAMHAGPGVLNISVQRHRLEAGAPTASLPVGDYARVRLTDGGPAADAETSQPTAHPFSAHTEPGQGSDLELALVHTIVKSHRGAVTGRGAPGLGTTFEIYLPTAEPVLPKLPAQSAPQPKAPRGQGQRVLVLDDEELIAEATARLLEHLGYVAESKNDPADVAALIRRNPAHYDVVITDESMPGLSGLELAAQIHRIRPDLPVLMMSGYGTDITPEKLQAAGITEVVRKPAKSSAIGLAVHRLLSRQPQEAVSEKP